MGLASHQLYHNNVFHNISHLIYKMVKIFLHLLLMLQILSLAKQVQSNNVSNSGKHFRPMPRLPWINRLSPHLEDDLILDQNIEMMMLATRLSKLAKNMGLKMRPSYGDDLISHLKNEMSMVAAKRPSLFPSATSARIKMRISK